MLAGWYIFNDTQRKLIQLSTSIQWVCFSRQSISDAQMLSLSLSDVQASFHGAVGC